MAPAPSTSAIIRAPKRTDMARWCARSGSRIASVARSHRYVCSCARALCGVQWRERGSLRLLTEAHAVTSCGGHLTTRGRQTGHLYCQRAANTRPDNRTYAEKTTKTTSFVSRERGEACGGQVAGLLEVHLTVREALCCRLHVASDALRTSAASRCI